MYQPKFTITLGINNRVAEIERIREVVSKASILPQQEVVLRLRAKIDSIHSSNSIEGNLLNKREVEKVLIGETVRASEKMILEAVNLKQAMDWSEKQIVERNFQQADILKLHGLLMKNLLPTEKRGKFRNGPIYIVDESSKGDVIRYIGPKGERVEVLIKKLLDWLRPGRNRLHPVLTAGIFHYQFVSIHPFSDGNGRMTRLLTGLFLRQRGYGFRKALSLDSYYWQNRMDYYQALSRGKTFSEREKVDITPWLDFFTRGFLATAQDLEKEVTAVSLSEGKRVVRLSSDELLIVDFTKQMGKIDLQDLLGELEIPERTAQRRLKNLVEKKILRRFGKGRGVYYQLTK